MSEAGVYTARGIDELYRQVTALGEEGFRIVTVFDTPNGDYHIVAQREDVDPKPEEDGYVTISPFSLSVPEEDEDHYLLMHFERYSDSGHWIPIQPAVLGRFLLMDRRTLVLQQPVEFPVPTIGQYRVRVDVPTDLQDLVGTKWFTMDVNGSDVVSLVEGDTLGFTGD